MALKLGSDDVAALYLGTTQAKAYLGSDLIADTGGGGGGGYEGPLDIVADAVVAFGQRAMSAADRGSAVYTIRENSGDTTQSFSSDATTGAVSSAAITAFLDGVDGFVAQWVNKGSSATDLVQADTAKQPQWQANIAGGNPAALLDGLNDFMLTAGNVTLSDPFTVFAVVKWSSNEFVGTIHRPICGQDSIDPDNFGPDWVIEPFLSPGHSGELTATLIAEDETYDNTLDVDVDGSATIPGLADTVCIIDCVLSVQSADFYINGVSKPLTDTGSSGTNFGTVTSPFAIGQSGQTYWNVIGQGHVIELVVCPGIPADRVDLRANIATYYGVTLP
jgi:hypothetical protein